MTAAAPDINPFEATAKPKPKANPAQRKVKADPMAKVIERKAKRQLSSSTSTSTIGILEEWVEIAGLYVALGVVVVIPPVLGFVGTIGDTWDRVSESRIAQWLNLAPEKSDAGSDEQGSVAFKGLKIEAPYFIDDSPPGSYDFTLIDADTDSVHVAVPSPCNGKVTESGNRGGYGNALAVLCDDGTELFMAHFAELHLKKGDAASKGQSLGIQGTTGNSSGEHVHLEVTLPGKAMGDRSVTRPYVEDVLFPFWRSGQKSEGFTVAAYKAWIARQEGGNNYNAINPDSGALGKYQFMPETMRSNALRCDGVGFQPTADEFLRTPELQEKVMDCYLGSALKTIQKKTEDPLTQCRMMASHHYSGNPDLYDDQKQQFYNGQEYPSIAEYTLSVCEEIL